jgi:hypothetical protein
MYSNSINECFFEAWFELSIRFSVGKTRVARMCSACLNERACVYWMWAYVRTGERCWYLFVVENLK